MALLTQFIFPQSTHLILVPLLGVIALNLPLGFFRKLAFPFAILFAIFQGLVALRCPWALPGPALFAFSVDNLSRVLLLSISLVVLTTLLTGMSTIVDRRQRFNFVNLVLLANLGMNGVVMVTDVFSLYVFIEIASVASFILIALQRDRDGLEGAFKYIVLSAMATAMMLSAIALLMMLGGGTSFSTIAAVFGQSSPPFLAWLAGALFMSGLFIKSGVMPFHGWLPDAYSAAPPATSVLLAGIVTKTTGVYALMRLVITIIGLPEGVRSTPILKSILLLVGAISIVAGALAALGQSDFKRMLAYSSISQVGYIILGLGIGTPLGIVGAIFHLFNHSVFKSLLFVNAAAVEQQTGTRIMDRLGGLSYRMPVTSTSCLVALLSTAGVPPLAGFWSKLIIVIALWQAGLYGYAVLAVLASILTLAYFLSMERRVFFGKLREGLEGVREAAPGIVIAALILTAITLGVGVLIPMVFGSFILPINGL